MEEFFTTPSRTGPAYGFAVFVEPEDPPDDASSNVAGIWRNWMPEADEVQLDEDGLGYVEARLGTWMAKPRYAGKAATGASLFLGDLLVARIPSAGWRILNNGYPFITLGPGLDLDVLAAGRARRDAEAPDFVELYRRVLERAIERP